MSPPIDDAPRGAFSRRPPPSPSDIGSMPRIIASVGLITGRRRVVPAAVRRRGRRALLLALLVRELDDQIELLVATPMT